MVLRKRSTWSDAGTAGEFGTCPLTECASTKVVAGGGKENFLHRALVSRPGQQPRDRTSDGDRGTGRRAGASRTALSGTATTREFLRIVSNLSPRGYFEQAFEKDCVDNPATTEPAAVIEDLTGRAGLWEMAPAELDGDGDAFCDLIEVLHDLVAQPLYRTLHSYAGCGWHYSDFSRGSGQALYRWAVNDLLDRSHIGLRLAESGEDIGRLIETTDEARGDLMSRMTAKTDGPVADRVRHAIALFRSRAATEEVKRSAAIAVALVLEERRGLLTENLLTKDEGAPFRIANQFAIRHQNDGQHPDYDPVFRD